MNETTERLLKHVGRFLAPVADLMVSHPPAEGLRILLRRAGIDDDNLTSDLEEIAGTFKSIYEQWLHPIVVDGELPDGADLDRLESEIRTLFAKLGKLDADEIFWETTGAATGIGTRLLDYLLVAHIERHHRTVADALTLAGVIAYPSGTGAPLAAVEAAKIVSYLRDPGIAGETYGWNTGEFGAALIFARLQRLLWGLGAPAVLLAPDDVSIRRLVEDENAEPEGWQLRLPLLHLTRNGARTSLGLSLLPLPPRDQTDAGLALVPYGAGSVSETIDLPDLWRVRLQASADATVEYGVIIRPGLLDVGSLGEDDPPNSLFVRASLERDEPTGERMVLLGAEEGARLEVGTIGWRAALDFTSGDASSELLLALAVDGGRFVLPAPDGFLRALLPSAGGPVDFSFTLGWSSLHGLHFEGSSSLDVTLPQHVEIGPVHIEQLTLELVPGEEDGSDASAIRLAASGNIKAALGPAVVTVEGLGLEASLAFPEERDGNLGIVDFRSAVKPPTGAGLVVDAAAVVGGGYLAFDPEDGRYVGAVHLEFQEQLVLKAVGILTTRMPDGSEGFSLLVIISAEFAPVQLGFGFTLNGVGGLLGVHRRADVAVLRDGLKAGTLGSVLFPDDPVANAPKLISDLEAVFPIARGRYVIGPMAILGWGNPNILTAEIGVVIHLPAPVELILLGRLRMALPAEERAVVSINMDVLGVVDFGRSTLSLDATLFDSRLTRFPLSGDMALRAGWGRNPNFALAVGGLHPDYDPPPGFPDLDRVSVSLTTGNNPRLRLEAYLALTSNTAQVGARLDAYAEKDVALVGLISVSADLGFDVLFEFSPFRFVASMYAAATLRRNGQIVMPVSLDLNVSGPAPGLARGQATATVCGVDVSISFDRRFSSEDRPSLPEADPFGELVSALEDPGSWSGELPAGARALVSLRKSAEADAPLRVHPLGALTVRQSVVPLETEITRFGATPFELDLAGALNLPATVAATLPQRRTFAVGGVELNGRDDVEASPVKDQFAPGQFLRMSDAERLAAPSYQRLPGGLRIGSPQMAVPASAAVESEITYDEIVVDEANDRFRWATGDYPLSDIVLHAAARYGARARSAFDHSGATRFRASAAGILVEDPSYVVARTDDLTAATLPGQADVSAGLAHVEAAQLLNRHLTAHPADAGLFQVVAAAEVIQP